ncbi:adhesion G-protein coupled receptor G4 [Anolis sagrei]|uniref:adhesion G-protein coupled receptor G4 n=1 Tax=Anolis sagrei TaxID=38937 RepID=UPI0035207A82
MGKYASLHGHPENQLCSFTVCIDINTTDRNLATWPAFSYDVNGSSEDFTKAELALSMNKSTLQVFILGYVVEIKQNLPAFKMHRLCCIWDGEKRLLEIFHDGSKLKTVRPCNVTHECLRPGGTLALGRLHKNLNGVMVAEQLFTFTGFLHYFQMWDSVRDQQKMTHCDRGNVISWQDSYWCLDGIQTESAHDQHCGKEEATPPLASTTPGSASTETFYKIQMISSMYFPSSETFDYYDAMDLLRKLFQEKLYNLSCVIMNIQIKLNLEYSSKSIVRITSKKTKDEMKKKLEDSLISGCDGFNCSMKVEDMNISDFDPEKCLEDVIQTKYKGIFQWPETAPADVAQLSCPDNTMAFAERTCILQLTEQIGFKMSFNGRNASIVTPKLALALLRPDPENFQGIAFAITSYDFKTDPKLKIRQAPFTAAMASVFLPGLLRNFLKPQSFEPEDHTEIQFSFFGTTTLFQDSSFEDTKLNSYVVGASLEDTSVRNLKEPVNVILQHLEPNVNNASVHCVFWDFSKNGGDGGWNSSGCESVHSDANYTICNCSHLTHFGVLLDIFQNPVENEADNWNLTLISNVGCGISSIFLGLALIIYLSIDKLHQDHPSRILINLCFALLMLNLTFLFDPWLSSFQKRGLCISVAVVLHYFLLASFTWMGLEAIHMYYALVRVFNIYVTHYILKLSVIGWGIPAAVVATVLAISRDIYGTEPVSRSAEPLELFCWIRNETAFYISVVAYFCLVFLVNASVFVTVLLQIQAMKAKNHFEEGSWGQDLLRNMKRVASLSFLLGLTWGFAFFATGPVQVFFLYLFALCNTFQGFFIFLFHCLMKENIRKQCRIHFCCGRFRLSYSQWATSATNLAYPTMRNLERKLSFLSLKSQKSCATNSTSNGSGSLAGSIQDIGAKADQIWHSPSS